MMQCPKCMTLNVTKINNTHYICNNIECFQNDKRTQFYVTYDEKIKFPYSQIFRNKDISRFYKKRYLKIKNVGNMNL